MYDQLGGGFHRYSVDARWLVPHFEKMLYDNALLADAYLEAYQATGEPFYRRIVEETLDYVLREMTEPAGGVLQHAGRRQRRRGRQVLRLVAGGDSNTSWDADAASCFCYVYDVTARRQLRRAQHPELAED